MKSTLTGESRQEKVDTKTCLFCGFSYHFRTILDKLIDDKNVGKMREMTCDLATAVFNDGWTVVNHKYNHHPIVNIIMGVRSLHTLRTSIDTMGQEKTMDFITVLILEHIKEIGENRVLLSVWMGCATEGTFVLIQEKCPWV
jgi:hypothetical protein